jgi:hypothetical protein
VGVGPVDIVLLISPLSDFHQLISFCVLRAVLDPGEDFTGVNYPPSVSGRFQTRRQGEILVKCAGGGK